MNENEIGRKKKIALAFFFNVELIEERRPDILQWRCWPAESVEIDPNIGYYIIIHKYYSGIIKPKM